MTDIAKHIRIFSIEPDDEYVNKRTTAVKAIEDYYKKSTLIDDILSLANKINKAFHMPADLDAALVDVIEKALKKQSAAFVAEGEELQIAVCALVAALQYLEKAGQTNGAKLTIIEVFALGCWSALSFQSPVTDQPKLEALRIEMLTVAKTKIQADAVSNRNRLSVPELKSITESTDLPTFNANAVKAISPIVENLKTNAVLDREEIDVLWWKLNDWSEIADKKYSALNEPQAVVIKGFELAKLLRRVPHPVHYQLVAQVTDNNNYNGQELLEQLGDLAPVIASQLKITTVVSSNPELFPLLNIINGNSANVKFLDVKRPLKDWAGRSLLEGTMLYMEKFLNDGK